MQIHGHRGCRGIYPENSMEAFKHAISLGIDTLEFDLVLTKSLDVLISHDPYFSHEITILEDGSHINPDEEHRFNIYTLDYSEIKKIDVGSKLHPRFPEQKNIFTNKIKLDELLDYLKENQIKIHLNAEIKSRIEWDNIYHPNIELFSDLVIKKFSDYNVLDYLLIQCFDERVLRYINRSYPHIKLSFLVENGMTLKHNLERLTFQPYVYSPEFIQLTEEDVLLAHMINIQVIPWTLNTEDEFKKAIDLKVDGIITDYPDRLLAYLKNE
jgi:glycerophosphoryl diester phosphodiesterase